MGDHCAWAGSGGRVPVVAQTPCFGPESRMDRMDQHSKGLPRPEAEWGATLQAATRKLCAARRSSRDNQKLGSVFLFIMLCRVRLLVRECWRQLRSPSNAGDRVVQSTTSFAGCGLGHGSHAHILTEVIDNLWGLRKHEKCHRIFSR